MLHLGIDTGGTFTDAVIMDEGFVVLGSAKAPTTRHDLAIGIRGAVLGALENAQRNASEIGLVGLSTTLATNAIVEGQGGRVGLVMIGFEQAQMERAELKRALGTDPVVLLKGGHSVFGDEAAPLDLEGLERFIEATRSSVEAYAVAAMFSVRNAAHERRAIDIISKRTGIPVSASHYLANALDGPKRALTALLNARLIPMVSDLVTRTGRFLIEAGITAPLMVVRGNGALMAASEAMARPVETVLSGPAASAVGACFLTGLREAVISDIGGTTTDVGIIRGGIPDVDPLGASIGGYRTMVEAIRMTTIGLGGDSEVWINDDAPVENSLSLGPSRVIPIAALAAQNPELVHGALDLQLLRALPAPWDGRFALLARRADTSGLAASERDILNQLSEGPKPLETIIRTQINHGTLMRLVSRGLVTLAGLTPTDAAHILGHHAPWDAEASRKAAQIFLRRRNRMGLMHAGSASEFSTRILAHLVTRSADFILESCADAMGISARHLATHPVIARALERKPGLIESTIRISVPIIGLGASAPLHYPAISARLGAISHIPEFAGVANAIGAIVGHVRREAKVLISQPDRGRFRVHEAEGHKDFPLYEDALHHAEAEAHRQAFALLQADGAQMGIIELVKNEKIADMGGEQVLVEAQIIARANGRPAASSAQAFPENPRLHHDT